MQKARTVSPRFRLWMAGVLILVGALILVSTSFQQTYYWVLHPPPSGWGTVSDRTYSGVLSESNQSVVVPLEDFLPSWGRLHLSDISTNDTPITLTVCDWNNTVVLQLANCSGNSQFGPTSVDFYGALANYEFPGTPSLTIARETGDVRFSVRVVIEEHFFVDFVLVPYYSFLVGYVLSLNAICGGFIIIETVIHDLRLGLI